MSYFANLWALLKSNDLPNWVSLLVSLFIWPPIAAAIVVLWSRRTRQSVPHFLVTFTPAQGTIGNQFGPGVVITFINRTGSVAYLSRAHLIEMPKRFPVPPAASRDVARAWRELALAIPPSFTFDRYETILQTNIQLDRAIAFIATAQAPGKEFYDHRPPIWRRWLRWPKYFTLDYVVVIGDEKFLISMVY
jgi:hypothetical protein